MAKFKKNNEGIIYDFSDRECMGRACWNPGKYSLFSNDNEVCINETFECLTRAKHGCNKDENPVSQSLYKQRKLTWKLL